jgi:Cof subfamily protein (haloacid dehalogenase superfamily)
MIAAAPVRLIATDLDGTLLRSDKTISRRTVAALRGAADAGIQLVAATGRQPGGIPIELVTCGFAHLLGANGAICLDLCAGEILFEELLPAATLAEIAAMVRTRMPGARLSAARDHGLHYLVEPGYLDLIEPNEKVPASYLKVGSFEEVVSEPTLKVSVRHPELSADQMMAILADSGLTGFQATTSGAPFLEIGGAGVNKASGLIRLCALLGIASSETLAAGDARNDLEMLTWAGRGVAMANASAQVKAIADQVTASNNDDGLAQVIETVLNERRAKWNRPATAP